MEGEIKEENMGFINQELELKLLDHPRSTIKGGLKTMPSIIVNEAFQKVASTGLMANMIFYLTQDYHMEAAIGSSILSIWSALSYSLAIFGAFLSDSYLGRFRVIAIGSFSGLLGMGLLWMTSIIPQLKPLPCDEFGNGICNSATAVQLVILFSSFGLISIGAGCIGPCSIAFGADQLNNKDNPNNERVLDTYFSWYYASTGFSTMIAYTVIVYIQDHFGWQIGFAVPAFLMVLSSSMFLLASPLYIKVDASDSLLTGFVQVLVVAFKNRNISLPLSNYENCYHQNSEPMLLTPTDNLRFLNKACIIQDPEGDLNLNGSASNPWSLCTVEQVESLKALLKIMPLWSTGFVLLASPTLTLAPLQAKIMNRHITSDFEIPAGSFTVFLYASVTVWIICNDRIMEPLLARYTGQARGLSPKLRMGVGLVVSILAMAVAGIIESIRRELAIKEGLIDDPHAVVDVSAMWLVPQYALLGIADSLVSIGQIEFFYTQFPKTMSSIAVAVWSLGVGVSSFVGSLLISTVDAVTSRGGNLSWLSSNFNKGHVDYFCWLLVFLNTLNFIYFLICCRAYGHSEGTSLSSRVEEERI